ncbi:hypothetical protein CY35_11G063400 [Sphagnum magellanicum]|nr:hypothetical protein CY35_11G063400 [Sphagnum magellanicum]
MMAELLHSSSSSCPPFSTSLQPSFLFLSRENNNNFKHPPISSSCTHFAMDFLRRRHRPAGPGGGGRTTRSSSSSDCKIVGSTKGLRGFTHQVLTVTTTTTGGRSSRRRKEIITTSQQSFQDAASSSTTTGNNKKQNVFLGQSFLGVDDFFFRGQCGRRRRKLVLQQCESERASAFNLDSETSKYLAIGEQQRDIGSFGSLDGGVELDTSVSDFFVAEKSVAAAGAGGGGGGAKDDGIDVAVAIFDSTAGDAKDENTGKEDESPVLKLKELLRLAKEDLEMARANSTRLEEEAQTAAEKALALWDQVADAERAADAAISQIESIVSKELAVEDNVKTARAAFVAAEERVKWVEKALEVTRIKLELESTVGSVSLSDEIQTIDLGDSEYEARVELVEENSTVASIMDLEESVDNVKALTTDPSGAEEAEQKKDTLGRKTIAQEEEELDIAKADLKACELAITKVEAELAQIQMEKMDLQKKAIQLSNAAQLVKDAAAAADEDVVSAMFSAEEAVALEVKAAERVSDAEIALQKANILVESAAQAAAALSRVEISVKLPQQIFNTADGPVLETDEYLILQNVKQGGEGGRKVVSPESLEKFAGIMEEVVDKDLRTATPSASLNFVDNSPTVDKHSKEDTNKRGDSTSKEAEVEKAKSAAQQPKKSESSVKEPAIPKSSTKKSSRFFSASYFSSGDEAEFAPSTVFSGLGMLVREHLLKVVVGMALLLAGGFYLNKSMEKRAQLLQPPEVTTSIGEVKESARPLIKEIQRIPRRVKKLIAKLPHQEVNEEEASLFDVLWLLLASVIFVPIFQKIPGGSPVLGYLAAGVLIGPYALSIIKNVHGTKMIAEFGVVFLLFNIGLEVLATAFSAGLFAHFVSGVSGPAAIVIGNGLALSSTAVVLQVLQERGESTSRHGRATFSVLLFQDLAVVVLLILIPLISPNSSKGGVGFNAIAEALGLAAVKAVVAITGIIAGGRLLLRPIYKRMADNHNAEIFAANTLLVVLGTSLLTARAGLSMALGAFLAGLLLAETEFALQVESDIAPYRGLLLGLFFMTVGMSIDPKLFVSKFPVIVGTLGLLIVGKTLLVTGVGRYFGLSTVAAARAGVLLAPGGEFAFVAFGDAVNQGIMTTQMSSFLFLVVGLSMAITPWLAAGGQLLASRFEQQDVRSLLPAENETDDLQDHIIVCGFGRVGQIIAQLLAERLIPFVVLDVRSERVSVGRALDLPVYFGDAGSREVLHKVGAERAAAAVLTLDTPGANYRTVWALSKNFPHVKTFVRAHDVDHGINLEKAGATAVKLPAAEIAATIDAFRTNHLSELTELSEAGGTSLGYGFSRIITKPKTDGHTIKPKADDDAATDQRQEGGVVAVP